MKRLDCYNAMNFDGGSSTVMYVEGRVANSPNAGSNGIKISNALIVKEEI
jgi:exopolysaccharide biosynthesis protein